MTSGTICKASTGGSTGGIYGAEMITSGELL
jgi:hypothetical protein